MKILNNKNNRKLTNVPLQENLKNLGQPVLKVKNQNHHYQDVSILYQFIFLIKVVTNTIHRTTVDHLHDVFTI